jgi:hypothetical protein
LPLDVPLVEPAWAPDEGATMAAPDPLWVLGAGLPLDVPLVEPAFAPLLIEVGPAAPLPLNVLGAGLPLEVPFGEVCAKLAVEAAAAMMPPAMRAAIFMGEISC